MKQTELTTKQIGIQRSSIYNLLLIYNENTITVTDRDYQREN